MGSSAGTLLAGEEELLCVVPDEDAEDEEADEPTEDEEADADDDTWSDVEDASADDD